ncbi:MAG: hypothetical protein JWM78_2518 [Verrucomicrobiaceae bacterium]|nr:hypothetical protein [Verrucomicrobiaceae bacterium]
MKKIILIALLALTACTPIFKPKPEAKPSFQELSSEHRYISALKVLTAQRSTMPDFDVQRDAILAQARDYENQLMRDVAELAKQQQFIKAMTLIENAQIELPLSREMSQLNEQLATSRERYTQRYLDDLIPQKALELQKEHALYLALQKSAADSELQNAIARHLADVEYFSPLITKAGSQALAQNDFAKAQQLLSIANQLTPSPQIAQQLARAEQTLSNSRKKQQVAQSVEREQRYRDLSNALLQSLQRRDFSTAREQLAQARELNVHTDEMDNAQHLLDNIIANYVVQQVDAGNQFYADGHIEEALRCWHLAEALSPTSDIKEKIDKAQKFIDRLQQLQKQPAKASE